MYDIVQAAADVAPSVPSTPASIPLLFGLDATQLAAIVAAVLSGIAAWFGTRQGSEARKLAPPEPAHASVGGLLIDTAVGKEIVTAINRVADVIEAEKMSTMEDMLKKALEGKGERS